MLPKATRKAARPPKQEVVPAGPLEKGTKAVVDGATGRVIVLMPPMMGGRAATQQIPSLATMVPRKVILPKRIMQAVRRM